MASSAALTASAALKSRVRRPSLLSKLAHPEDLLSYFPNGAYIGWSGFTGVGYPKCVAIPFSGEAIELFLFGGAAFPEDAGGSLKKQ
jgi:acetyl-CoA hydrolase